MLFGDVIELDVFRRLFDVSDDLDVGAARWHLFRKNIFFTTSSNSLITAETEGAAEIFPTTSCLGVFRTHASRVVP